MDIKEEVLDEFSIQYRDFCDTKNMTSKYDNLRFYLAPRIQKSKNTMIALFKCDNNYGPSCEELNNAGNVSFSCIALFMGVKFHWLAGLKKLEQVVIFMHDCSCDENVKKYAESLTEYLQNRVTKSKCNQYTLRTDCAWGLEETDIQDACNVIVKLLDLDTGGMSVSGELTRSTFKIHLNNCL